MGGHRAANASRDCPGSGVLPVGSGCGGTRRVQLAEHAQRPGQPLHGGRYGLDCQICGHVTRESCRAKLVMIWSEHALRGAAAPPLPRLHRPCPTMPHLPPLTYADDMPHTSTSTGKNSHEPAHRACVALCYPCYLYCACTSVWCHMYHIGVS